MSVSQLILLLALALSCFAISARADGPAALVYVGEQNARLELKTEDGKNYTGTVTVEGLKMPLKARKTDTGLIGTLTFDGEPMEFTGSIDNDFVTIISDGDKQIFKREAVAGDKRPAPEPVKVESPKPDPAKAESIKPQPAPAELPKLTSPTPETPKSGAKDPLGYKILQFPGGTVAKFDSWTYLPLGGANNVIWSDAYPDGRKDDYYLRAYVGTPDAQDMANLFQVGPKLTQQLLTTLFGQAPQQATEPKKCTVGGDEGMVESYNVSYLGKKLTCNVIYVKRKDVAVAVLGLGTDAGVKEFGRAVEIVAQSITVKESALEPGLVGAWSVENYKSAGVGPDSKDKINITTSRTITIFANATFTDSAYTGFSGQDAIGMAEGGSRGAIVKRGNALTFKYDNGKTWTAPYELYSNGLKLDGKIYLKN